ncbi:MAG: ChaN family lipoprotein [Flavobacteriales bacterium]|nr:ChaN family lipoprotein [Flavobacteriales bacterium]
MKKFVLLLITAFTLVSFKSDKDAYQIFDQNGKKIDYDKLLKEISEADIIMFGELHNNPIIHWLQFEVTKDIYSQYNEFLALGAEMYEADNQLVINEYLGGHLDYKTLEKEAKLWPNDNTDYRPLLDFARENQLTFVATNIPRRYAAMVHKEGFRAFNDLNDEAKKYIAPIPFEYDDKLPGYANMIKMMGGHGNNKVENMARAQASKDATMAHFILKNWTKGKTFIHYNGAYHSMNYEGIVWYLKKANPDLKVATIHAVEQADISELAEENKSTAHYIIAVPETMTKTH